jgi:two-component system, chemotaxis family, chemotaxis protein CheY
MRIGLLEDDLAIQEMVLLVLQDEGYVVTNFLNVDECLTAFDATNISLSLPIPVDALIVDWRLNGPISGFEVITQLRHNPRFSSLPIILTTAATFHDTEELQHLQVSLLEKPFSVDDMLSLIQEKTSSQS